MQRKLFLLALFWFMSSSIQAGAADIVILKSSDLSYYEQAVAGFKTSLSPTTKIREYSLGGQLAHGREIGKALRASPPDLVFAVGLKAAMAAKLEIFDTPVVFCMVLNPEQHGLPVANMTGIAVRIPAEAQLSALHSVLPTRHRIGLLYDEEHSGIFVRDALQEAKRHGLELVTIAVRHHEEIPKALRALLPKIDALWLIQDSTVVSESAIPFFLESTLEAKVPIFTFSSMLVQQGALGALVLDPRSVGQQAARIAFSRLKESGASAGLLQAPEYPRLALNMNSAEYLGVVLTPEVTQLAGQLFSGPGMMAREPVPSELIP
jgi:putative ABC transport system substrate-binding protein